MSSVTLPLPVGCTAVASLSSCTLSYQDITVTKKFASLVTLEADKSSITVKSASLMHRNTVVSILKSYLGGFLKPFFKRLVFFGVGYKGELEENNVLRVYANFSHPKRYTPPTHVSLQLKSPTLLEVSSYCKESVGLVAAQIRSIRKPDPYKGKGIRYEGEKLLLKTIAKKK